MMPSSTLPAQTYKNLALSVLSQLHQLAADSRTDLAASAGYAALSELHINWFCAVADGYGPRSLLKDIADVKAYLDRQHEFLAAELAKLPTPPEGWPYGRPST